MDFGHLAESLVRLVLLPPRGLACLPWGGTRLDGIALPPAYGGMGTTYSVEDDGDGAVFGVQTGHFAAQQYCATFPDLDAADLSMTADLKALGKDGCLAAARF
jgi:hypothetical protein